MCVCGVEGCVSVNVCVQGVGAAACNMGRILGQRLCVKLGILSPQMDDEIFSVSMKLYSRQS